ncbi:MAG: TolC family protein, partial [Bacteroidales bacterium]|nr:TolC family protein [Bacteroidales bacterium]
MIASKQIYALLIAVVASFSLSAQTISTYDDFISAVVQKNAGYISEKYNVEIAEAAYMASKVFNDPELEVTFSDNQDKRLKMGRSLEATLGYTFSLGGVRGQRMAVAKDEKEISEAALAIYLCNLKAEASKAWAEAWRCKQIENLRSDSYESIRQIALADSIRLSIGDININDAIRTSLESKNALNDLVNAKADTKNALLALKLYAGGNDVLAPSGMPPRIYILEDLDTLKVMAEHNRADLLAAELGNKLSQDNLGLVRATQSIDIGVNLGYAYNKEVRNEIAPAPAFHALTVGVTVPLKFSSLNKGERNMAQSAISQSEATLNALRSQIETEVEQAFQSYLNAMMLLEMYDEDFLGKAEQILESCSFGYSHGEIGLLELMEARRERNELYEKYIDAQTSAFESA